MKKFFTIIVMLLLVTISAVKAETSVAEITQVAADSIINQNSAIIMSFYEDMKTGVESLKMPAEHIYKTFIKQQVVESITLLILFISSCIVFTVSFKWGLPWAESHNESKSDNSYILPLVGIIVSLIGCLYVIIHLETVATGLTNPEYGAIRDIAAMIKDI